MMAKQMTARFNSRCPKCQGFIEGNVTEILYTPGEKATHVVCPAKVEQAPVARIAPEDNGVYVMPDGRIVAVVASQQNKGRTYGKLWIDGVTGERLTLAGGSANGKYEFVPGLIEEIARVGRKMNLEEAKQFILLFSRCARPQCGRKLTAKKSVERGIGPVCIKYFSNGTTAADLMGVTGRQGIELIFDEDTATAAERMIRETYGSRAWQQYRESPEFFVAEYLPEGAYAF